MNHYSLFYELQTEKGPTNSILLNLLGRHTLGIVQLVNLFDGPNSRPVA